MYKLDLDASDRRVPLTSPKRRWLTLNITSGLEGASSHKVPVTFRVSGPHVRNYLPPNK